MRCCSMCMILQDYARAVAIVIMVRRKDAIPIGEATNMSDDTDDTMYFDFGHEIFIVGITPDDVWIASCIELGCPQKKEDK